MKGPLSLCLLAVSACGASAPRMVPNVPDQWHYPLVLREGRELAVVRRGTEVAVVLAEEPTRTRRGVFAGSDPHGIRLLLVDRPPIEIATAGLRSLEVPGRTRSLTWGLVSGGTLMVVGAAQIGVAVAEDRPMNFLGAALVLGVYGVVGFLPGWLAGALVGGNASKELQIGPGAWQPVPSSELKWSPPQP